MRNVEKQKKNPDSASDIQGEGGKKGESQKNGDTTAVVTAADADDAKNHQKQGARAF